MGTHAGGYVLGHSEREIGRLSAQARMFEPFTRRMLSQAGLAPGMRVLDVGSGAGDVAFLCASIVGSAGLVIGMDNAPAAVEAAQQRAGAFRCENVTFAVGDPTDMPVEQAFDAIVGRLVLMHQPDPVAMLRKLARVIRSGGVVAFQEFDITGARSFPPAPTFDRCIQWIGAAFTQTGVDTRMGMKLYPAFLAAGLPAPAISLDTGIWGADDTLASAMVADVIRALLPVLVKAGIATEAEVDIGTLRERMQNEIVAAGSVTTSPSLIGAWSKV
jgi:SAM-dependent methyltransferase